MRYPNVLQTAHRLLTARDITGGEEMLIGITQRMVGLTLQHAWDRRAGGIFFAGPASFPIALEDHDLIVRRKTWWGQFEALKALLLLSCVVEKSDVYLHRFGVQWRYVKHCLIDGRYGGVFSRGTDSLPLWQRRLGARFAPSDYTRKGFDWKDASHEGRVYLFCLSVLGPGNGSQ
jgi:mannose/cellobiose epimerase-like protein (N-acyl-D-glucosamine 2-epimerase family)